MGNKYFKNSITALLIASFILAPISAIPKAAQAQTLGAYTSGLVPAITQLPLCKGKIRSAISSLFNRGPSLGDIGNPASAVTPIGPISTGVVGRNPSTLTDNVSSAGSELDSIRVVLPKTTEQKIDTIIGNTQAAKVSVDSLDTNETCVKNIGRLVIKMLLQKITLSTVNWINTGFDGKPAFIQDTGKFFEDIAKNEILQFGLEINNPELFPFGKAWLQAQAIRFNNKFADNARYSLDEMIRSTTPQFSAISFQADFSQGGWDAWSAMTQYPQNNPLGFQLMASNELQRRLEGTSQSVARDVREALEAADGFLGDQRCIEATTGKVNLKINRSQDNAALRETPPRRLCSSWEYVTPGSLIARAATDTISYPKDSLLKADDLNDAVAAIVDALLSRFSADIMEKGYANISTDGADGTFVYNRDAVRTDYSNQAEKDFTPVHLTSSWLSANPNFNIRTDLTQALIDEQRTYSSKLSDQNRELNSTIDGKDYKMDPATHMSNAYGLIPIITQLDYCIPGPHPGWEEDSRNVLDAVTNVIIPETEESVKDKTKEQLFAAAQAVAPMAAAAAGAAIGATLFSAVPIVGTIIGAVAGAIIGAAVGFVISLLPEDNAEKVRHYYSDIIQSLTGVNPDYERDEQGGDKTGYNDKTIIAGVNNLASKQGAVQVLDIMLERYIDLMHEVYNTKVLPSVYREARTEFNKLPGYAQIIANNQEAISVTKNTVNTLEEIKKAVDALNGNFPDKTGDEYEKLLKVQINAFGRLSANMVNGDDIADSDNLLKQIIDEQTYVYKDLLKGPLGCEQELQKLSPETLGFSLRLQQTTRMLYPFPILYTYDMPAGGDIPDPLTNEDEKKVSGLAIPNKTNPNATHAYGPGFLSFYVFQLSRDSQNRVPGDSRMLRHLSCEDEGAKADGNGVVPWCELTLEDILPLRAPNRTRSLGKIPGTITATESANCPNFGPSGPTPCATGPWEHTILVY